MRDSGYIKENTSIFLAFNFIAKVFFSFPNFFLTLHCGAVPGLSRDLLGICAGTSGVSFLW